LLGRSRETHKQAASGGREARSRLKRAIGAPVQAPVHRTAPRPRGLLYTALRGLEQRRRTDIKHAGFSWAAAHPAGTLSSDQKRTTRPVCFFCFRMFFLSPLYKYGVQKCVHFLNMFTFQFRMNLLLIF
jgi:hypothetical protein